MVKTFKEASYNCSFSLIKIVVRNSKQSQLVNVSLWTGIGIYVEGGW